MAQAPNIAPTGSLDTPFMRGRRARADELGDAVVRAAHWRLVACGALLGMAVLGLGNIYLGALPHWKPYYIVEACGGVARILGPAPEQVSLQQETITKEVRTFVETLRRVPSDRVLMGQDWSEAGLYAHVTPRGRQLLTQYVVEQDPLHKKEFVLVEVQRVLKRSERVYDVRWVEQRYSDRNERLGMQAYSGLFTVVRQLPKTEPELTRNPFGVFIDQFSFSKE